MTVKNLTIPVFAAMILAACGRNEVRTYTEEIQARPQAPGAAAPPTLADLPEDHPMRTMQAPPLAVDPVPENLPPDHPTRTMGAGELPMTAQLPDDHPMRAAPLTVDPVPENLPPGHPTLDGDAAPSRAADSAANLMRGRESEVPPPPAADDLAWDVPDGWRQQPGSGMRLASFVIEGDNSGALTTLIVLGGTAGNVEANIRRWRQQMELPPESPRPPDMISGNLDFVFVDMAEESLAAGKEVTTVGAMFDLGGRTAFLKFTGPTEVVGRNRFPFLKLAGSMRLREDGQ